MHPPKPFCAESHGLAVPVLRLSRGSGGRGSRATPRMQTEKNRKKLFRIYECVPSASEGDGVTIGRRGRGTVGGLRGCWARFCLRNHMYNNRLHSFLADRV